MKTIQDTPRILQKNIGTYEVALIYHVHRDTACSWCRLGILPGAKKVGRKWMVPTATLPDTKPRPMGKMARPKKTAVHATELKTVQDREQERIPWYKRLIRSN